MAVRRASEAKMGSSLRSWAEYIGATARRGYSSTFSLTAPTGVASGDLVIAFLSSTGGADSAGSVAPVGWYRLATYREGSGQYAVSTQMFAAIHTSTLSYSSFSNSGSQNSAGTCLAFRNCSVASISSAGSSVSETTRDAPTAGTVNAGSIILYAWGGTMNNSASGATLDGTLTAAPGSYTGSDGYARTDCGIERVTASGSAATRNATFPSGANTAWTVVLRPGGPI
jgi:hypothetical protein